MAATDINITFTIPAASQTDTNLAALKRLVGYQDRIPNPAEDPPAGEEYIDNPVSLATAITDRCKLDLTNGVRREVRRLLAEGNDFTIT